MLRSILGSAAVVAIGLSAAIGSVGAQEPPPAEELMLEEGMVDPEMAPEAMEPTAEQKEAPAPRVKGFALRRPTSCGEFKYWDGTQCADARDKKAEP